MIYKIEIEINKTTFLSGDRWGNNLTKVIESIYHQTNSLMLHSYSSQETWGNSYCLKNIKKFFAKYRTYLLHYANDSVEWYQTLLSIYNFADIKPIYTSNWTYNRVTNRHESVKKLVLDLTEDQKTNFAEAKKVVSAEKKAKKKLKLQK